MAASIKLKKQAAEFIRLMADPGESPTDSKLAKQVGVSVSTIRNWKKNPSLIQQIEDEVKSITEPRMPEVWESLLEKAVSGDVQAAKLIFQLRGELDRKEPTRGPSIPPKVEITFCKPSSPATNQKGAER